VGDLALFYESVTGLAVAGIARVTKPAFPDPGDPTGRWVAVEVAPERALKDPVPLAALKADPRLKDMKMFRQFRLSVTPVTEDEWAAIVELGGG
jgi:predicted RNA-binding protein with PUA-like domain